MLAVLDEGSRRGVEQIVLNPFATTAHEALAHLSPCTYAPRVVEGWTQVPAARRWLYQRLRDFGPHVVHAHLFHALVMLASTPRTTNARWVLSHQHGNHLTLQGRHLSALADRVAGRRYDRVVAISDFVRRHLVESYHYPPEKVALIQNGWRGQPVDSAAREPRTLVSVGNLRAEKGHAILLEAFVSIVDRFPDARLLLVGDGPLRGDLEHQVSRDGIANSVEFIGATDDVWSYYARASVFVLPSHHEMLGIAAMEAMAAGLPVVASSVGGIPEVVADGVTGYLVPPRNPRAFAARVIDLLDSPDRCREMGDAARESVQGRGMDRTVAAYFDLYEALSETR
jgi:glycosyltransferase involved in cell wall biosynthesis